MSVITIYKKIGETPLEALTRLRESVPEYKEETLSYAGRLDPMAAGVMLVLAGDANKEREKYLNLEKDYSAEILFGISTDTYDTLGLITEVSRTVLDIGEFEGRLKEKVGEMEGLLVRSIQSILQSRWMGLHFSCMQEQVSEWRCRTDVPFFRIKIS